MSDQQSSYKQIFKATTLFGGVQVINILFQIIRAKFVAILLGPTGMGIHGLLTSTTLLISGLTNCGLGTSAIKNVAEANASGNKKRVAVVIIVLRRWVWVTGLLGTLVTLIFSSWLSQITFGNKDYTLAFVWISITLLFSQISSGQMVLLQGLRKLKYLANASVTGAALGLLVSVPFYYIWGIDGIVPAIVFTSIVSMLRSWYFARKVKIEKIEVRQSATFREGKEMLKMGFMLNLSILISTGVSYLIKIYISNYGGVDQVGLYNAGIVIINTYFGMVFTAMGTDYYPRLSEVTSSNEKAGILINQQAEIAILIIAPILAVFLIYVNVGIILLYSKKFLAITGMIQWAALGMFFKAASWSIAIIFLAKAETKIFFWNELIANIYSLGLNILGYRLFGLDGLGISILITSFLYFIQVFIITSKRYSIQLNYNFIRIYGIQLTLGALCFFIVKLISAPLSYIAGSLLILLSIGYSIYELNKKFQFKYALKRKLISNKN